MLQPDSNPIPVPISEATPTPVQRRTNLMRGLLTAITRTFSATTSVTKQAAAVARVVEHIQAAPPMNRQARRREAKKLGVPWAVYRQYESVTR